LAVPKFDEEELEILELIPGFMGSAIPRFKYPVSQKEATLALYAKKPIWQMYGNETGFFSPGLLPDNVARGMVTDCEINPFSPDIDEKYKFGVFGGGYDMFGVYWEMVPGIGAMVRPGKPMLSDANEWYKKIKFPDVDSWDWERCREVNKGFFSPDKAYVTGIMTGWFERLISFMDFEGAIMALVDEDQQTAVHELFSKLSDLYIKIVSKFIEYFPEIDIYNFHDDWGGQKETFFSPAVAREMIVPYMRLVTDYIHGMGKITDLHSCGNIAKQVPNMIEAGWDSWSPQPMNDTKKIYEEYGDKIIITVHPDEFDPETTTEEEQRGRAARFAERFCNKNKPCTHGGVMGNMLTVAYQKEMYRLSRIRFSE